MHSDRYRRHALLVAFAIAVIVGGCASDRPSASHVSPTATAPRAEPTSLAGNEGVQQRCVNEGYSVGVPPGWATNREKDAAGSCTSFHPIDQLTLPIRSDGTFTLDGILEEPATEGVYVKWERTVGFDDVLKGLASTNGQTITVDAASGNLTSSAPGFLASKLTNPLSSGRRAYDLAFVAAKDNDGIVKQGAVTALVLLEHPRGGVVTIASGPASSLPIEVLQTARDAIASSLQINA
jgi:hypothetical protein